MTGLDQKAVYSISSINKVHLSLVSWMRPRKFPARPVSGIPGSGRPYFSIALLNSVLTRAGFRHCTARGYEALALALEGDAEKLVKTMQAARDATPGKDYTFGKIKHLEALDRHTGGKLRNHAAWENGNLYSSQVEARRYLVSLPGSAKSTKDFMRGPEEDYDVNQWYRGKRYQSKQNPFSLSVPRGTNPFSLNVSRGSNPFSLNVPRGSNPFSLNVTRGSNPFHLSMPKKSDPFSLSIDPDSEAEDAEYGYEYSAPSYQWPKSEGRDTKFDMPWREGWDPKFDMPWREEKTTTERVVSPPLLLGGVGQWATVHADEIKEALDRHEERGHTVPAVHIPKNEIDSLRKELELSNAKVKALLKSVQDEANHSASMAKEVKKQKKQADELISQVNKIHERVHKTSTPMEDLEEATLVIELLADTYDDQLTEKEQTIKRMQSALEDSLAESKESQARATSAWNRLSQAQRQVNILSNQLAMAAQRGNGIEALEERLNEANENHAKAAAAFAEVSARANRLSTKAEELAIANDQLKSDDAARAFMIRGLEEKKAELEKQLQEATNYSGNAKTANNELVKKLKAADAALAEAKSKIFTLEESMAILQHTTTILQGKLEQSEARATKLQKEIEGAQKATTKAEQTIQEYQRKFANLSASGGELQAQIETLQTQISTWSNSLIAMLESDSMTDGNMDELIRDVTNMKQRIELENVQLKESLEQANAANARLTILTTEGATREQQLKEEVLALQRAAELSMQSHQAAMQEKESHVARIQRELANAQRDRETAEGGNAQWNAHATRLQNELVAAQRELAELRVESDAMVDQLNAKLREAVENGTQLSAELAQSKANVAALEMNLSILQAEHNNAIVAGKALESGNEQLLQVQQELTMARDTANANEARISAYVSELEEQVGSLNQQVGAQTSRADTLALELQQAKQSVAEAEGEIALQANASQTRLEELQTAHNAQVAGLQEAVQRGDISMAQMQAQLQQSNKDLQSQVESNKQLELQYQTYKASAETAVASLEAQLKSGFVGFQQAETKAKKDFAVLNATLDNLKEEKRKLIAEGKKDKVAAATLEGYKASYRVQGGQLETERTLKEEAMVRNNAFKKEVAELRTQLDASLAKVAANATSSAKTLAQLKNIKLKLSRSGLGEVADDDAKWLDNLIDRINTSAAELKKQTTEMDSLKTEVANSASVIANQKNKISEMEKEMEEMRQASLLLEKTNATLKKDLAAQVSTQQVRLGKRRRVGGGYMTPDDVRARKRTETRTSEERASMEAANAISKVLRPKVNRLERGKNVGGNMTFPKSSMAVIIKNLDEDTQRYLDPKILELLDVFVPKQESGDPYTSGMNLYDDVETGIFGAYDGPPPGTSFLGSSLTPQFLA